MKYAAAYALFLTLASTGAIAAPSLTRAEFIVSGNNVILKGTASGVTDGTWCSNMVNARVRYRHLVSHTSNAGPYYFNSGWRILTWPNGSTDMFTFGNGALSPQDPDTGDVARIQFNYSCNGGTTWSATQWQNTQWFGN